MRKPKTEKILVIYTTVLSNRVYIKGFSRRADEKLIPHYTTDPNLAHDFDTPENAKQKMDNIVNHSKKLYATDEVEVIADTRKYLKSLKQQTQHHES